MNLKILEKNICELLAKRYGTIRNGLAKVNLSPSAIYNIQKGSIPSIDKIEKIADICNVSIDYLLGRTAKEGVSFTLDQEALLAFFNECSHDAQTAILRFAEYQADLSRRQTDTEGTDDNHNSNL